MFLYIHTHTQSRKRDKKNVRAQVLTFRSRVIWYKRSYSTIQPFYNVISAIYNIYVRPFRFSHRFLFLSTQCWRAFIVLSVSCSSFILNVCVLYIFFCSFIHLYQCTHVISLPFFLYSLQCELSMCKPLKEIESLCHAR